MVENKENETDIVKQAYKDLKYAVANKRKLLVCQKEDFEFALGKHWKDSDKKDLSDVGVLAITINKIHPILQLILGIESQNRTDYKAHPEGEEDSLTADIVTLLLKNAMKRSEGNYKISEEFEDGLQCGEGYLEPYIDNTWDLLTGQLKFKKWMNDEIYPDPDSREYDQSDARYIFKLVRGLTKNQVIDLFPDKEDIIKKVDSARITDNSGIGGEHDVLGVSIEKENYQEDTSASGEQDDEKGFDLIEYQYVKRVKHWVIFDRRLNAAKMVDKEKEADEYINRIISIDPQNATAVSKKQINIPEIWVASVIGSIELKNERLWSYPIWKSFTIFPYYAYKSTANIQDKEYKLKGITRIVRDLNLELNKRRTQELRILNTSANSGWLTEKGAWVNKDMVRNLGSSPGINLEYNKGFQKPEKIIPTPLSQGHAQMTQEYTQDMKEASGINTDLLAMNDQNSSGRAIHLRQKQGLVMVQKLFDNLSRTKRCIGRFILSIFPEIYDVDKAIKVVGEAFISKNFSEPVMQPVTDPMTGQPITDPQTGQPAQKPVVDPNNPNQLLMRVNEKKVAETFNNILNDSQLGIYEVAVAESPTNETIRLANSLILTEMQQAGIPVPPDLMVENSPLPLEQKQKFLKALQQAQQAQAAESKGRGNPKEK
jgi:hypothetical protein